MKRKPNLEVEAYTYDDEYCVTVREVFSGLGATIVKFLGTKYSSLDAFKESKDYADMLIDAKLEFEETFNMIREMEPLDKDALANLE